MITQAVPTLLLYGIVLITSVDAWATRAFTMRTSQHERSSRDHDTRHFCQEDDLILPLEDFLSPLEEDELESFPQGTAEDLFIVQQFLVPEEIDLEVADLDENTMIRLNITSWNMTLPVALMALDHDEYPSLSRARKACRKGNIVLSRTSSCSHPNEDPSIIFQRGRVGDRVHPGDWIGIQERMSGGKYSTYWGCVNQPPSFELPVVYQDDHFAIVNKPAGVLVYQEGGKGRNNVRFALPYVLERPNPDIVATDQALDRPVAVHRLDKPTSGLLVAGKSKPAVVHLARQFEDRRVQKTYTAIVYGLPTCDTVLTAQQARDLGVDIDMDDDEDSSTIWHLAANLLDGKEAVTVWRVLRSIPAPDTLFGCVSVVELKPKTGRYHQLRRHMAWMYNCPLVGDPLYGDDIIGEIDKRWHRGLMLCSNRLTLFHPYYNSEQGRREWERLDDAAKYQGGSLRLTDSGEVQVSVHVPVPLKFQKSLEIHEKRSEYSTT
jgi:23S rRNA-/tRNA-specific pseudouridylate synthase